MLSTYSLCVYNKCVKRMNDVCSVYLCIDLKTFFASVECVERGLNPFKTNLVVADESRGKGALCLAISPKMKALGIKNRCRLFEIPKGVEYITAIPRMNKYIEYSANIYAIYLKYISSDECFLDITSYINLYHKKPKKIVQMILDDIYETTGITTTVGIGTNLYLTKIALDIMAKHSKDNMGVLTENLYKKYLWHHQPLTDFWHIGVGIANHLHRLGINDMYTLAHYNQHVLYKEFGLNAEYIIDHAWGREPTTIADIKRYKPSSNSISNSQVLFEDYEYKDALLVLKEMVELNVLKLVDNHLVTNNISLYVGYSNNVIRGTGGQKKITAQTNSLKILMREFIGLFEQKTNKNYPIRQIGISFQNVLDEYYESYDLFSNIEELEEGKRL